MLASVYSRMETGPYNKRRLTAWARNVGAAAEAGPVVTAATAADAAVVAAMAVSSVATRPTRSRPPSFGRQWRT